MVRRSCLCALLASLCGLAACSRNETSIASQNQSNWLNVDPSALSSARPVPPPKILPETHFAAAQLLEVQGQWGRAIVQYQRATLLNHNYLAAYHRLGLLLGRVGRHREAVAALERAVAIRPDVAILHNNLGFAYAQVDRFEDAEGALRYALELEPDFARAHINLGMVLGRLGRFEEAYEQFASVLPESAARYDLGLMYRGENRNQDAALAFIRALELDPGLAAASKQLDKCLEVIGPLTLSDPLAQLIDAPTGTPIETARVSDPTDPAPEPPFMDDPPCEDRARMFETDETDESGYGSSPAPTPDAWDALAAQGEVDLESSASESRPVEGTAFPTDGRSASSDPDPVPAEMTGATESETRVEHPPPIAWPAPADATSTSDDTPVAPRTSGGPEPTTGSEPDDRDAATPQPTTDSAPPLTLSWIIGAFIHARSAPAEDRIAPPTPVMDTRQEPVRPPLGVDEPTPLTDVEPVDVTMSDVSLAEESVPSDAPTAPTGVSTAHDVHDAPPAPIVSTGAAERDVEPMTPAIDPIRVPAPPQSDTIAQAAPVDEIEPLYTGVDETVPLNTGVDETVPLNTGMDEIESLNTGMDEIEPLYTGVDDTEPSNPAVDELEPVNPRVNDIEPLNAAMDELESADGPSRAPAGDPATPTPGGDGFEEDHRPHAAVVTASPEPVQAQPGQSQRAQPQPREPQRVQAQRDGTDTFIADGDSGQTIDAGEHGSSRMDTRVSDQAPGSTIDVSSEQAIDEQEWRTIENELDAIWATLVETDGTDTTGTNAASTNAAGTNATGTDAAGATPTPTLAATTAWPGSSGTTFNERVEWTPPILLEPLAMLRDDTDTAFEQPLPLPPPVRQVRWNVERFARIAHPTPQP